MYSNSYSCQILMKHEFAQQILKNPHIKFHENPASGSQAAPCRQTERHDEASIHHSQFCKHT